MGDPYNEAVTDILPPDDNMRIGVVSTVTPLAVNVQGADVLAGHLGSYGPIAGDNVALLRQDQSWLCLGSTRSGTQPGVGSGFIFSRERSTQAVATGGVGTIATYDTNTFNPHGIVLAAGVWRVPIGWDGLWDLSAYLRFSANAAGFRLTSIEVNGVGIVESRFDANTTVGNPTSQNNSLPWVLVAGDTVQVRAFQNSGVGLTIGGVGADHSVFSALYRGTA